jgi:hypothetical protein
MILFSSRSQNYLAAGKPITSSKEKVHQTGKEDDDHNRMKSF